MNHIFNKKPIFRFGACGAVKERMSYVASVLEEFSELDSQICIK